MGAYNHFLSTIKSYIRIDQDDDSLLPQYKIIELPNSHNKKIVFQVNNKRIILKILPEELMRSDLLLGFSRADIAVITHLGTKKELEKKGTKPTVFARIAQQIFGKGGKTKFMLKMLEQDQLVEAIPEEVLTNKEALNMLEGHEAAMIGYAAAENRLMEIHKQTYSAITCRLVQHDLLNNEIRYLDLERNSEHTLPLTEVFYNKDLLNLFNKLDQQMISFVAGELHQQAIYPKKVVAFKLVSYAGKQAEYHNAAGEVIKTGFVDLAFESTLLEQFSQRDRDMIRFAAGEFAKEKEMALRLQKKH